MNTQSFQNIPTEMGLFTFYKQQQQEEQTRNKLQHKTKKKNKNRSKKKLRYYDYQKSINKSKSKQKVQSISTAIKSKQFLKSRQFKNQLKSHLSKIQEKALNSSQDDFFLKQEQVSPSKQQNHKNTVFEKGKTSPQIMLQKKQPIIISPQTEPISADSIRKIYFKKQNDTSNNIIKSPRRQFAKDRIRTQVNYNLHKNHLEYIQSTEKQLIASNHHSTQKQPKKQFIRTPIRSFKEKLQFLDSNSNSQMLTKNSDRYQQMLINCKTSKELHQQNKRYFNNLIQNLHIQPQYNQTVYRILRQTLRLPQLDKTTRHLKTQHSSPQVDKFKMQARSHALHKNPTEECNLKFRQRQSSLKQRNFGKIAVKGKIISQPK